MLLLRYENSLKLFLKQTRHICLLTNKTTVINRRLLSGLSQIKCAKQDKYEITEDVKPSEGAVTVGQKVKQAGKDASYLGVLLVGFGVTGALVWYVANELLFGFSSNSVYSKALNIVKEDLRATEEIGDGMKGYGEETSRGRRRHVSFQEYVVDGVSHMRIQFYVSGSRRKATVHAEAKQVGFYCEVP